MGICNRRGGSLVGNHIVLLEHLDKFEPQNLSNTVWALYATSKESHPKLFKKVADHIVALEDLDRFNGQDFSNTVWAYAAAGESHPALFQKLTDTAIKPNMNSQYKALLTFYGHMQPVDK